MKYTASEIISVGTELLLGDIINTDAAFLARELAALGIPCYYQSVVGDNPARLQATLKTALSRSDLIFLTGNFMCIGIRDMETVRNRYRCFH